MIYWILEEVLGYSYGIANFKDQVPVGANVVESEKEYLALIEELDKKITEQNENFGSDFTDPIDPIKKSALELEIEFLKKNATKYNFISNRYNKTTTTRNGFSTFEIYQYLGGKEESKKITEKVMAIYIYENLNNE